MDDKYNHSRTEVLGSDGSLIMCRKLLGSLFLVLFAARRRRTAAKVHAGKDEDGAEEEPGGDLLVEEPPGEEYGSDGIEIDPVGGNNGSEFADNPVP